MSAHTPPRRLVCCCSLHVAARQGRQGRRHSSTLNHFISPSSPPADLPPSAPLSPSQPPPLRLAVKDNIATAAPVHTTCGSRMLAGHQSPFEATIVRQLRARGCRLVGKTNMDEFGMGSHSTHSAHGPVRNPRDPTLSVGGSSGGSAAAVAAGDADIALGTDTGGSVRVPAAYGGVVGFKPSYGMLSRWGVIPYANSLDTVGLLARDVDTIGRLLFETGLDQEHDPRDPTSLSSAARRRCSRAVPAAQENSRPMADPSRRPGGPISKITIGIPLEYNIEEVDPLMRRVWADAAKRLADWGARVVPVSLPTTRQALSAYYVLAPAEASSNLAKYDGVRYGRAAPDNQDDVVDDDGAAADKADDVLYAATRGAGFGDEVRRRILLGTFSLSSAGMDNYFLQAQRVRRLVRRDFDRVFLRRNPLCDPEEQIFDLEDMDNTVVMEDKLGPAQVDFLLTPTVPGFAPGLDEVAGLPPVDSYMNDVFTVPASLAGLPAVSVPVAIGGEEGRGSVAGLQMIGQYWDDRRVLELAGKLAEVMVA